MLQAGTLVAPIEVRVNLKKGHWTKLLKPSKKWDGHGIIASEQNRNGSNADDRMRSGCDEGTVAFRVRSIGCKITDVENTHFRWEKRTILIKIPPRRIFCAALGGCTNCQGRIGRMTARTWLQGCCIAGSEKDYVGLSDRRQFGCRNSQKSKAWNGGRTDHGKIIALNSLLRPIAFC
jgi:hypothetical protein